MQSIVVDNIALGAVVTEGLRVQDRTPGQTGNWTGTRQGKDGWMWVSFCKLEYKTNSRVLKAVPSPNLTNSSVPTARSLHS